MYNPCYVKIEYIGYYAYNYSIPHKMIFIAGFIQIFNPLWWLSFVIGGKWVPAVSLTCKDTDGLDYADCTDGYVNIIFTDAKISDDVMFLRLKTVPSVGERWAVITDQSGVPVPFPCISISILQVWSEPLGLRVFKRDDNGGMEMMCALDKAMTLHWESLSEFASQITSDMTSPGMTSHKIISLMGKKALQTRLKTE
jgi:hypothetical protein